MLVQILNIQKSVSVLHILSTLFWRCIDIPLDWVYLDHRLIGFFYSGSLVDPLGKREVFIAVFPSIEHSSAVNDVVQAGLNSLLVIIEGFTLLDIGLHVVTKLLTEGALTMVLWESSVDWCRFNSIPFC